MHRAHCNCFPSSPLPSSPLPSSPLPSPPAWLVCHRSCFLAHTHIQPSQRRSTGLPCHPLTALPSPRLPLPPLPAGAASSPPKRPDSHVSEGSGGGRGGVWWWRHACECRGGGGEGEEIGIRGQQTGNLKGALLLTMSGANIAAALPWHVLPMSATTAACAASTARLSATPLAPNPTSLLIPPPLPIPPCAHPPCAHSPVIACGQSRLLVLPPRSRKPTLLRHQAKVDGRSGACNMRKEAARLAESVGVRGQAKRDGRRHETDGDERE
ncbi:unnamed protein product [Closterium sp. NIES-65]|nr:unnamed protein product [Closterium sp. NIES-65]